MNMQRFKQTNFLYMLYTDGSLTNAVDLFTSNKTRLDVADLMYELLGYRVKFARSCDGARWQAGMAVANTVSSMIIGMTVVAATMLPILAMTSLLPRVVSQPSRFRSSSVSRTRVPNRSSTQTVASMTPATPSSLPTRPPLRNSFVGTPICSATVFMRLRTEHL